MNIVSILKEKDRLCRLCRLVDIDVVSNFLDNYLNGFVLEDFTKEGLNSGYSFVKNEERVFLSLRRDNISLNKYTENSFERIYIDNNLFLDKRKIERRDNGILVCDVKKKFDRIDSISAVLSYISETRYVIEKDNLFFLLKDEDIFSSNLFSIFMKIKSFEFNNQLDDISSLKSVFKTYINKTESNSFKIFRRNPSSFTFFNGEDVSSIYDKIKDEPYKLDIIYDLYRGIVNERNLKYVYSITKGQLPLICFDLLSNKGIKKEEARLIGKDEISVNNENIIYLRNLLVFVLENIKRKTELLECNNQDSLEVIISKDNSYSLTKKLRNIIKTRF